MALTLADVLREHWPGYARAHRSALAAAHYRAVRCVLACRSPAMGGRLYRCKACRKTHFAYHSCNHRNCPQCGALDQQIWSARQEARLLPVPYFMVTFTLASELRSLCLAQPKTLYRLMLKESAAALSDVIASKTKGARAGFTSVLHTWGRQMQHHPHVHLIVPAIALGAEGKHLLHPPKDTFLVHYRPLAERFRSRLQRALKDQHPDIDTQLTGDQRRALAPATQWNVQLQPVGRGQAALRYLARYVQRSAFHPKRLLGYDPTGHILLRWTSSDTRRSAVMRLHPHEFIRRWLLHVLPKGFTRLRHYGFLSSAATPTRLKIRLLLGELGEPLPKLPQLDPFPCPQCGGVLHFVREIPRLRAARGPPLTTLAPHHQKSP
ncbi:MAG: transposase [Pseudomonadota bacterium]